ncbi:hypothetical protein HU200_041417 [Digitaria exilis]|uniref:DUF1618 domain-containing protein n=1 Tax=Digitaria exilis TaxID=1010633 RepID=A0A835EJ88_9POAL|nr:hypothetical protein HU200_041417 [Digitaria exilis]
MLSSALRTPSTKNATSLSTRPMGQGRGHIAPSAPVSSWPSVLLLLPEVDEQQKQQQQQPGDRFLHFNSKVISIGGEAGTMGFVDLFRGILLCDVLTSDPKLRYIPLPKPIWSGNDLSCDARLHRDIAVVKDHIKYVELQVRWKTDRDTGDEDRYHTDGWTARTFSIPVVTAGSVSAASYDAEDWSKECDIKSSDEIDVKDNPSFDILPRPLDKQGRALPPFKSVIVCQPTLSLGDHDNPVYFMVKDVPGDDKGWVISICMKGKKLLGAAEFAAKRTDVATFTYVHSKISNYLIGAAGTYGDNILPVHL